jgi:hypothetical protein
VKVTLTSQPLIYDCGGIMMSRPEKISDLHEQVIVDLELHPGVPTVTRTIRSRASSAA